MERRVKPNFLDAVALIRSIQRAEGNPDCFGRNLVHCREEFCAWRPYCLKRDGAEPPAPVGEDSRG
jgi:hypothetical protein